MSEYSYDIEEFKDSLRRVFKNQNLEDTYIHMDGDILMRNKFLRESWNYANKEKLLTVKTIELEQETFMKGYLTEKGKELLEI